MQEQSILKPDFKEQNPKRQKLVITNVEVRIGIGVALCLLFCYFMPAIQKLAVCTAVIMCMQDVSKISFKSGLTRILGVICGGVTGICVVVLDNLIQNSYIFIIMAGIGVVLTLLSCKIAMMPGIAGRVGCMTFVLVILVDAGTGRICYALNRLIGTLLGALAATVVTAAWNAIHSKINFRGTSF